MKDEAEVAIAPIPIAFTPTTAKKRGCPKLRELEEMKVEREPVGDVDMLVTVAA